jgi:cytochrome oxidase Cu insertion factor (SCO1/SenC/PrrC family)
MIALLLALVLTPDIHVMDEYGRQRSTSEFRGSPVLLAPMYAHCPLACPMIARGLKKGLAQSSASPTSYRVILFSFDPRDTPADLQLFRERQQLPLSWTIVRANNSADAHRFLDALGYRYADTNGLLNHLNAVVALTPELQPAKFLLGTSYSGPQMDEALRVASGQRDWVGRYGGFLLAALLFTMLLSMIYILSTIHANDPAHARSTSVRPEVRNSPRNFLRHRHS